MAECGLTLRDGRREQISHGIERAGLLLLPFNVRSRVSLGGTMLHLIWYIIVGFIAGCVAKALLHTHLSITWTIVLGIIGSIIGGAVTHLFYPRTV
jgi:uncharacterized membrane protein